MAGIHGTSTGIASAIEEAPTATPNDTDVVGMSDGGVLKQSTWAAIKAFFKTYFDPIYAEDSDLTDGSINADFLTVTTTELLQSGATASEIAHFDASKNLKSLPVATYPSLTELAYVKGVSSALQTQLTAKAPLADPAFTGDATFVEVTETVDTPTVAAGAITIDWADGTKQIVVTAANTTITLPAAAAGKGGEIIVQYGGVHTITWAGGTSLKPDGGTAPVATSVNGKYDSYIIVQTASLTFIHDGGRNA